MKRLPAFAFVLFATSIAFAQPPVTGGAQAPAPAGGTQEQGRGAAQTPPPMTNLQVIPKDTPRPVVLQQMQAIAQSLGVQCNYCHVFEGRGGRNDFASDEKSPKKTARAMMIMARDINQKLPLVVGKSSDVITRVGCVTCHRGVPIPKQITEVVTEAAANGGADAGLAKFKELREKFYGGQSYDFSESGLIAIAQRAQQANKSDDAIAYLKANLEYYPKSSRTYQAMAQIKNAKGDKESAIKDLEKAVELDPNNAQAKAQLTQLKGQSQ